MILVVKSTNNYRPIGNDMFAHQKCNTCYRVDNNINDQYGYVTGSEISGCLQNLSHYRVSE